MKSGNRRPTEYTITEQIEFNATPDSTYGYELRYYKSLTGLSSSNTTNAVLTRFPKIYLFGGLAYLHKWAEDDAQATVYYNQFLAAIDQANRSDKKGRYPSGKSMKVEGSTP